MPAAQHGGDREPDIAEDLRRLAQRGISRAFEPPRGMQRLGIKDLSDVARSLYPEDWGTTDEGKAKALQRLIKDALPLLDERDEQGRPKPIYGDTKMTWSDFASCVYNLSGQSLRHVDGRWDSYLIQEALKKAGLPWANRKLREHLTHSLRLKLAHAILKLETDGKRQTDANAGLSKKPELDATERPAWSRTVRRLQELSRQLSDDLDLAGTGGYDNTRARLGTGLYIHRDVEHDLLEALESAEAGTTVVVKGQPGHGKSSLLWATFNALQEHQRFVPFLLEASWLQLSGLSAGGLARVASDELLVVAEEVSAAAKTALFLIDTADLLLHSSGDRFALIDFCDTLIDHNALVVLTSRPEEARQLSFSRSCVIGLSSYDVRTELPQAIKQYVSVFCPDAAPEPLSEKVDLIMKSVARGLTVREVCQNPLHLRLLFELYAPDFPALEIDVSGLYERYWERRVVADLRSEILTGSSSGSASDDLSGTAKAVGIALLAAGRTEARQADLLRDTLAVIRCWQARSPDALGPKPPSEPELRAQLDVLSRRGVLPRASYGTRFFHQTIFEYAAARGLVDRDGWEIAEFLHRHMVSEPSDLFIGAVFEQVLILLARDRLQQDRVDRLLTTMAGESGALQRIALGVIAYRPELRSAAKQVIATAEPTALRRYVELAPSVSRVRPAEMLGLLAAAWQRSQYCRLSVLGALERLAVRDPSAVLSRVRALGCGQYVRSLHRDGGEMIKLWARVAVMIGGADPAWAREELGLILRRHLSSGVSGREVPINLLQLMAERWEIIGSAVFASEVEKVTAQLQAQDDASGTRMRDALAGVLSAAWLAELTSTRLMQTKAPGDWNRWWQGLVDEVCTALEGNYKDFRANARMMALADLLLQPAMPKRSWDVALDRTFRLTHPAPFALQKAVVARWFSEASLPAEITQRLLRPLDDLPAPEDSPQPGPQTWAHVLRESLYNADISPGRLAALLGRVPASHQVETWLAADGLAKHAVKAAVGGHPEALAAVRRAEESATELQRESRGHFSYGVKNFVCSRPDLTGLLITCCEIGKTATHLTDVVKRHGNELRDSFALERGRLKSLVDLLLELPGVPRREGAALWLELHRCGVLASPSESELRRKLKQVIATPEAAGNILRLAGDVALRNEQFVPGALELSMAQYQCEGDPPRVLTPRGEPAPSRGRSAGSLSLVAREVWLDVYCRAWPLEAADIDLAIKTASSAPTDAGLLGKLGHLATRLAEAGRSRKAGELVMAVGGMAVSEGISTKQENTLANNLRRAMVAVFDHASEEEARALVQQAHSLPKTHARILVASAARTCFDFVREDLEALLDLSLPAVVAQQIHDDIRARRRTGRREALPELLTPLSK